MRWDPAHPDSDSRATIAATSGTTARRGGAGVVAKAARRSRVESRIMVGSQVTAGTLARPATPY